MAAEARRSHNVLLSEVLQEMRGHLRAHSWLLMSFFIAAMGGFTLFLYTYSASEEALSPRAAFPRHRGGDAPGHRALHFLALR